MVKVKKNISEDKGARLIRQNAQEFSLQTKLKLVLCQVRFQKGRVGIVSKSGTLIYEAADQVVKSWFGVFTAIGIGGESNYWNYTKEVLELFINDPETDAVVMIGEIGGSLEAEAARWYKEIGSTKPVVGFIAGQTVLKVEQWDTLVQF